jgi:hypothetical protein
LVLSLTGSDQNSVGPLRKARQRWEKELRDPDDVFLQAEERKKELAKQRKRKTK